MLPARTLPQANPLRSPFIAPLGIKYKARSGLQRKRVGRILGKANNLMC